MAKDILKEAIADAKAVREVALANAKAALEEAFTPKLQSMLSAKLSEELNEEEDLEENYMDEEMDETYMDEEMDETMDEMDMDEEMDEITGMDEEDMGEGADLDEEIDLEEILNELELEEGEVEEETVDEAKDMDEETMDEAKDDVEEEKLDEMEVNYSAETANRAGYKADYVHEGDENFDLDALLEEINNLDEEKEDEVNEGDFGEAKDETDESFAGRGNVPGARGGLGSSDLHPQKGETMDDYEDRVGDDMRAAKILRAYKANPDMFQKRTMEGDMSEIEKELEETKSALETVRTELNEVNLLNSKLLYVNRIFKANTLDEGQKLRVVETLDKAETAKEAKLIYETIKDTFNVAKSKKASFKNKTKSLKEGIGMASKAAGTSTAPKKEVIAESDNLVNRFQKLANIKINH